MTVQFGPTSLYPHRKTTTEKVHLENWPAPCCACFAPNFFACFTIIKMTLADQRDYNCERSDKKHCCSNRVDLLAPPSDGYFWANVLVIFGIALATPQVIISVVKNSCVQFVGMFRKAVGNFWLLCNH